MIIESLLNAVYWLMDKLMFFNIPNLPDEVYGHIDTAFTYISAGAGVVANYTPLPYLMTLFGVILAVDAGILVFNFVMWVLRKIPMLGIS